MKIEEEIKQSKFRSARQKAIINLIYTANWFQNKQQDFFKPYGVTSQQFNILRILRGQQPNSISGTEIKARMLDKNSDVSRLLDRLALKNLIIRKMCPSDKRAADIYISDEGLQLLEEIDKQQEAMDSFLALTEDDAKKFSDLLDKARG